jgi:asparagine synthase (glutamine-hydrolysing)
MCGIAGLSFSGSLDELTARERVRNMANAIVHRGPDEGGEYVSAGVALGIRRLSIIDRAHGQQPMLSDDGALALVFNGEIYNYKTLRAALVADGSHFRTDSDTEVVLRILERHGVQGIQRLEGMFCFALWDERARRLTLARDWLGQKSLYWTRTADGFAFASEIKALLTLPGVPRSIDLVSLSHYMSLRYLPGDGTFFAGIHKLPPAHVMTIEAGRQAITEIWRPAYEPKHALSERVLIDRLDELLEEVVREHLMSEVPLGAFLSGGIDSSLIVYYASKALSQPLTTFAIGVSDEEQSELPWARQVAERFGTRHIETVIDPDLAVLTPRMVAALEEPVDPFGDGVYVVAEVARRHVTVALGGDGGDELFAGYDRYKGQSLADLYSVLPRALRHRVLRPAFRLLPDSFGYNTLTAKLRWLDRIADSEGFQRYADSSAYLRFPHAMKAGLFTRAAWAGLEREVSERLLARYFEDGCATQFLDKVLHADCATRLAENQLPIVDKLSMAHSLELRSPFLDRRVAQFAMQIPASLKLKQRRLKYVARELGRRHLPRAIVERPKKGFGFPFALWIHGPLRELMQNTIRESRLAAEGIFRVEPMQQMLDEHVAGRMDHNYRLWMLFNLEIFWRHYIAGESIASLEGWVSSRRGMRRAA